MELQKALIDKATADLVPQGNPIPVQFNPELYTLSRDINYAPAAVPGLSQPLLQFVNGNVPTLEMELFLDTYEQHAVNGSTINNAGDDVRTLTQKVAGYMDLDPDTHAPPILIFTWASLSFTCVLARASQKFIMFLPDGTPVRARLQVLFNGYRNPRVEQQETKRQTADYTRIHVVGEGETVSSIAGKIYNNTALWRPIALYNEIEDPAGVPVGTRLLIPRLPFEDPQTGEVIQ